MNFIPDLSNSKVIHSIESVPFYYTIPATILFVFLAFIVKRRYFSHLRRFPGPFWASVTRWWLVHQIFRGDHEKVMLRLHAKYGPIIRISPFEVAISDPEAIKIIYGHTSNFTKVSFTNLASSLLYVYSLSDWYLSWHNKNAGNPSLFSERNERTHASRRRHVSKAYSMSTVVQLEEYVDSCSVQLLHQFERLASLGPIDLGEWLQMYAFDVVGELAFGRKFGFLEEARDIGWMGMLERLVLGTAWTGEVPYLLPLIQHPFTSRLIPSFRRRHAELQKFGQFARNNVTARIDRGSGDRKDMLTYTLEAHLQKPDLYTKADLISDAHTVVFAGSDTTAIALRSIFYHVLKNPHVYARLQEEIDTADAEGRLSPCVTFAESNTLPYLIAVTKEAMRIHPSVSLSMPRLVPSSGATLCNEYFPPGVVVGCNPYVIHRDKKVFGPDADTFRPERWLDEKRAKEMEKAMITFGAGNRTCVGKNISLMEMQKVVPQLLRYLEFRLVDQDREWTTLNRWFNTQKGLEVYVRSRKKVDLLASWQNPGHQKV